MPQAQLGEERLASRPFSSRRCFRSNAAATFGPPALSSPPSHPRHGPESLKQFRTSAAPRRSAALQAAREVAPRSRARAGWRGVPRGLRAAAGDPRNCLARERGCGWGPESERAALRKDRGALAMKRREQEIVRGSFEQTGAKRRKSPACAAVAPHRVALGQGREAPRRELPRLRSREPRQQASCSRSEIRARLVQYV